MESEMQLGSDASQPETESFPTSFEETQATFLKSIGTDLPAADLAQKYSISEVELGELILAFRAIDTDGSGTISAEEITSVLRCVFWILSLARSIRSAYMRVYHRL
jgi:hypothetical protein